MEFQYLVVVIALLVLMITLFFVYFNLPSPNTHFPRSLTNCPDYWEINPTNGNCILPSQDNPISNLGRLTEKGNMVYKYKTNLDKYEFAVIPEMFDPSRNRMIRGTPVKKDGYNVYAYNLDDTDTPIPVGYMPVENVNIKDYNSLQTVLKNVQSVNEINFNDPRWTMYDGGGPSKCQIKKWANFMNINWDGMNTYNDCKDE